MIIFHHVNLKYDTIWVGKYKSASITEIKYYYTAGGCVTVLVVKC